MRHGSRGLSRPRRWSDLTRVERVDLYTRFSLYLFLWLFCGALLVSAVAQPMTPAHRAVVVGGGFVVTVLGSLAMTAVISDWPVRGPVPWLRLGVLAAGAAVYLAAVLLGPESEVRGSVAVLVVANLCAAMAGLIDRRVTVGLLVVAGALCGLSGTSPLGVLVGVGLAVLVIFTVRVSLWLLSIVTELDAARLVQSRLAVAEERLRFSRDVHDVLGRRLSAIAVQSELAAALAARGDERAADRMLAVRGVAHDALSEARELARGYRPVDLPQEVEGARSLLQSAGIEVLLDVEVVPRAWHEAAAWVVRESVTNVLRHSAAARVSIAYRDGELRIDNDGARSAAPGGAGVGPGGTGLSGVGERLQPLGASLRTDRDGDRWSVIAHLPGAGPLSATTGPTDRIKDPTP